MYENIPSRLCFLENLDLEVSPEDGQQLQEKDKKRRKKKGEENETEKPKDVGHILESLISTHARAKIS